MKVAIRTDASIIIGTGHLMRCLTLADYLRGVGAETVFVCRDLPGLDPRWVTDRGYELRLLDAIPEYGKAGSGPDDYAAWLGVDEEQDAREFVDLGWRTGLDWIVADHYGLSKTWQAVAVDATESNALVIDDLANRTHGCDILLDQNYYANMEDRYQGLVNPGCELLLGPRHALLRPEFKEAARELSGRTGQIKSILVFYGGFDQTNETAKALEALALLRRPDLTVRVIVGAKNSHKEAVRKLCGEVEGAVYLEQVDNMAELMALSDVSLGGGGTTTWERCLLGLPTFTTEVADNQRVMLRDLSAQGAIWHLGNWQTVTPELLADRLAAVMQKPELVRAHSDRCLVLTEGLADSESHPVVETMMEVSERLRNEHPG